MLSSVCGRLYHCGTRIRTYYPGKAFTKCWNGRATRCFNDYRAALFRSLMCLVGECCGCLRMRWLMCHFILHFIHGRGSTEFSHACVCVCVPSYVLTGRSSVLRMFCWNHSTSLFFNCKVSYLMLLCPTRELHLVKTGGDWRVEALCSALNVRPSVLVWSLATSKTRAVN